MVRLRRGNGRPDLPARQGARQRRASGASCPASRSRSTRPRSAASTTRRPPTTRQTNYVYNAAAETGSALQQQTPGPGADPAAAARQHVPRPRERRLRARTSSRAGRTTARSAPSTSNTGKVVWKFDTPQPERGGVTTTASGRRLRRRRRRQPAGVRRQDRECALEVPDRLPDRLGPVGLLGQRRTSTSRSRSAGRRPRRAAARCASQLQVFSLGGSQTQSTGPMLLDAGAGDRRRVRQTLPPRAPGRRALGSLRRGSAGRRADPDARARPDPAVGSEHVEHPGRPRARRMLGGQPVAGVKVKIGRLGRACDRRHRHVHLPGRQHDAGTPHRLRRERYRRRRSTGRSAERGWNRASCWPRRAGSASGTRSTT